MTMMSMDSTTTTTTMMLSRPMHLVRGALGKGARSGSGRGWGNGCCARAVDATEILNHLQKHNNNNNNNNNQLSVWSDAPC